MLDVKYPAPGRDMMPYIAIRVIPIAAATFNVACERCPSTDVTGETMASTTQMSTARTVSKPKAYFLTA